MASASASASDPAAEYKPESRGGMYLRDNNRSLPKTDSSIYYIAGHSCSLDATLIIPRECKYAVYGVCGITTSGIDHYRIKFLELFLKGDRRLAINNKEDIELLIKFGIHIYNEGMKNLNSYYVLNNMNNQFFDTFDDILIEEDNVSKIIVNILIDKVTKNKNTVTSIHINDLLGNVIKTRNVRLSGIIRLGNYGEITYNNLKEDSKYEYPLFNFETFDIKLPEEIPFDESIQKMAKALGSPQLQEGEVSPFPENYDEKMKLMAISFEILETDFFKEYILSIKSYIYSQNDFTELIKYMYQYSIFPTVKDVLTLYKTIDKNSSNNTLHGLYKIIEETFFITQKDLFYYFPGVYYNTSCRSLCNPSSESAVVSQRAASGSVGIETSRKAYLDFSKRERHNLSDLPEPTNIDIVPGPPALAIEGGRYTHKRKTRRRSRRRTCRRRTCRRTRLRTA